MAPKAKLPSVQQTINQAKKNLATTAPRAPRANAKPKTVKASRPKLPRQTQNLVNQQKKINKTTAMY